jgi:short-subunit dehydrogenase
MNLKNRKILITGASSGIGAATAVAAAREGAQMLLLARNQTRLDQVAASIRQGGGRAQVYPVDLTDAQAVQQVAARIKQEVGVPDILLNNAGAGQWLSVEETSPEAAVSMMAAPYFAAFFTTRAFLPEMIERNSGTIVNTTSIASRMVWPGAAAYTAGRWAMRGFTEALRADLHATRIRTLLVTFAKVASPYWENNPGSESRVPKAQAMIPTLTPEQAARAILTGIQRDQREVVAPFMLRVLVVLNDFFPYITRWLLYATGYRRNENAHYHPQWQS